MSLENPIILDQLCARMSRVPQLRLASGTAPGSSLLAKSLCEVWFLPIKTSWIHTAVLRDGKVNKDYSRDLGSVSSSGAPVLWGLMFVYPVVWCRTAREPGGPHRHPAVLGISHSRTPAPGRSGQRDSPALFKSQRSDGTRLAEGSWEYCSAAGLCCVLYYLPRSHFVSYFICRLRKPFAN